ncbi:hypothetical protein [Paenibacillus terrigena]|uniref:hypothetical protein n=1 Tax=Paenibacillus terrigena TaxID=369333 RepID=UPI000376D16C|nr:hypothetical protein [Paenibacillus terrigena]
MQNQRPYFISGFASIFVKRSTRAESSYWVSRVKGENDTHACMNAILSRTHFFSPFIFFLNTIFEKYSSYDDNDNDGDDGRSDELVDDFGYEIGDDASCVHDLDVNGIVDRDPFVEILEH